MSDLELLGGILCCSSIFVHLYVCTVVFINKYPRHHEMISLHKTTCSLRCLLKDFDSLADLQMFAQGFGRYVTNHICPGRYVTKRSDMYKNYMDDLSQFFSSPLGQFVTLYFGRFVTSYRPICHNFILDDLSQVILS